MHLEAEQPFWRVSAALLCLLPLASCDAGTPSEQPIDAPPVHVVDVLAATSIAPDGGLVYEPLARDGTTQVLPTTAIKIRFDRLLLPASVARQSVCLQPLLKKVDTIADCTVGAFLQPAYDPVRREVTFRQSPGGAPLLAETTYVLTAYVAVGTNPYGFLSFEGTPLEAPVRFQLRVRGDGGPLPPWDLPPSGDRFCAAPDPACTGPACARSVSAILGPNGCGFSSCHGGPDPAEGLDLATADALVATALDRTAHETQTGEHARDPEETPARFGRAMPVVDPAVPGNSYLVYKLLANPANPLAFRFPGPAGALPPEVRRIRSTIVTGMPMPPSSAATGPLRDGEAEWIADWLLQGAPVRDCP